MSLPKIHTIWKYAIGFYTPTKEFDSRYNQSWERTPFDNFPENRESILYDGRIEHLPDEVAEQVAEIHPQSFAYYKDAMAVLYKGYGSLRGGTEFATKAIESKKSSSESEATHVIIWNIFSEAA